MDVNKHAEYKKAAPYLLLVDKLPVLDDMLITMLHELSPEEWHMQTVARLWKVRDAAAHLLDGNIRTLSLLRDGYQPPGPPVEKYDDLVGYLNMLNADWVKAMNRVSPNMLLWLLSSTGEEYCAYMKTLDPFAKAVFPVAWAGEEESRNWMHIAREYTEKFLHQQQIRDATGRGGLLNKEYYHPFLSVCMLALPYTLRNTRAADDTIIALKIPGEGGGEWYVHSQDGTWSFIAAPSSEEIDAEVVIEAKDAWKLFSKSVRVGDIPESVRTSGNPALTSEVLNMVSFMV